MDSLKYSLNSILCGLQRDFLARNGVDIKKNTQEFKSASNVFNVCFVKVKRKGKVETKHKYVISEEYWLSCISLEFCLQSILQLYKTKLFFKNPFSSGAEIMKMY